MTDPTASAGATALPQFGPALRKLWPHGDQHIPGLLEGIIAAAPEVFARYKIPNALTVAIMMGQFSEECGAGLEMVENGHYSEQGLLRTFPTHFTGTMAARYAENPRMIFDIAYGGRMGNAPPPSDDGSNYCGHGLSQVTGKYGYEALQKMLTENGCDIDIMENPELVCDPKFALECAVADFVLCGCLPFAQEGNIIGTTKKLNGGLNGLSSRQQWTARWKPALGVA
jgi:putative chitinase